jgi:hypothetical protein
MELKRESNFMKKALSIRSTNHVTLRKYQQVLQKKDIVYSIPLHFCWWSINILGASQQNVKQQRRPSGITIVASAKVLSIILR